MFAYPPYDVILFIVISRIQRGVQCDASNGNKTFHHFQVSGSRLSLFPSAMVSSISTAP
jgi:hypothetical protein